MTLAPRLKAMGSAHYQTDGDPRTSGPGFGVAEHLDALDKPLRWAKPRRIFVNSMSDLFHAKVSESFIADVFAIMYMAPQHTFQLLTKRHARMRSVLSDPEFGASFPVWPLPNVWVGVSVEDQKWANLRIPALLHTPAAVRFLSCEPLLGPVSLTRWLHGDFGAPKVGEADLDWVIVGGESGRGARPMDPSWPRTLRDECTAAGVAYHFKQWGSHDEDGRPVHKKVAGRMLDGRTWDEFPESA